MSIAKRFVDCFEEFDKIFEEARGLDQDNLCSQIADEMRRRGMSEDRITMTLKGAAWGEKGGLEEIEEKIRRQTL